MHDEKMRKQMGLYKIENINKANISTISVNRKQYFGKFKNRTLNKKHKVVRRDSKGMNFESYAERIATLKEPDLERNKKYIVQKKLSVTNTEMKMTSVNKVQLAHLKNKRYYLLNGIVSLPYGHPLLSKIRQIKKPIQKFIEPSNNEKITC